MKTPCLFVAIACLRCTGCGPHEEPDDAGTPDSGRDAGAPDAGEPDAGPPDAGRPHLTATPSGQNFGSLLVGSASGPTIFYVANDGGSTATLSLMLAGTDPGQFVVSGVTCGGLLAAGGSCQFSASFAPVDAGAFHAQVALGDSSGGLASVPLMGTGLAPPDAGADAGPPNVMFVTSLEVVPGNLGGIAGADAVCQACAADAGLTGTYRAWLATSAQSAAARLGVARGWVRPDGQPFTDSVSGLTQRGQIFYVPRLDEHGAAVPFYRRAVTAALPDGTFNGFTTCSDWTVADSSAARAGYTRGTTRDWTTGDSVTCAEPASLYCFGVDRISPVVIQPVAGRLAFVTGDPAQGELAFIPDGGLASADAQCMAFAVDAGLPGSFRAFLSDLGVAAASRFDAGGPTWVRLDGLPLVGSAPELFDAGAALNGGFTVTARGAYVSAAAWSGALEAAADGGLGDTCAGWRSNLSTDRAGLSLSSLTWPPFTNSNSSCDYRYGALRCLQE